MIHLLLVLCGLAWVLGHWAFLIFSVLLAAGTLYLLWNKGYLHGFRGGALALLLALLGLDGLIVAALLHETPRRGGVVPTLEPYEGVYP